MSTTVQQAPDAETRERFDAFARGALRHLAERGHPLNETRSALAGGGGVERFG